MVSPLHTNNEPGTGPDSLSEEEEKVIPVTLGKFSCISETIHGKHPQPCSLPKRLIHSLQRKTT